MKFGLISDTHDFLDPKIVRIFRDVDHIFHAGDVGSNSILKELEQIAPVTAVSGNTDDPAMGYPRTQVLELAKCRFLVHHIVNPQHLTEVLEEEIRRVDPDVVVYGHTHKPSQQQIGSVLFVNPGYAGKQRFALPRTVAILHCSARGQRMEFVSLTTSHD